MSSSEEVSPLDGLESPAHRDAKIARSEIIDHVWHDDDGRPIVSYKGDAPFDPPETHASSCLTRPTCLIMSRRYLLKLYEKCGESVADVPVDIITEAALDTDVEMSPSPQLSPSDILMAYCCGFVVGEPAVTGEPVVIGEPVVTAAMQTCPHGRSIPSLCPECCSPEALLLIHVPALVMFGG